MVAILAFFQKIFLTFSWKYLEAMVVGNSCCQRRNCSIFSVNLRWSDTIFVSAKVLLRALKPFECAGVDWDENKIAKNQIFWEAISTKENSCDLQEILSALKLKVFMSCHQNIEAKWIPEKIILFGKWLLEWSKVTMPVNWLHWFLSGLMF